MLNHFLRLISGLFRIARPRNCLAASLLTLLGYYLGSAGLHILTPASIRASMVVFGVVAANNIFNDYRDVAADGINQPNRPIPSGQVSKNTAFLYFLLLGISTLSLAVSLGPYFAATALILLLLGVAYTCWLKNTVLLGNGYVALMAFTPILYGGWAANQVTPGHGFASILIFLLVFANEILKTIWDAEGDIGTGTQTITTALGVSKAVRAFQVLVLIFTLCAPLPWICGYASLEYLLAVLFLSVLPLLVVTSLLTYRMTRRSVHISLWILGILWFSGMIVIVCLK